MPRFYLLSKISGLGVRDDSVEVQLGLAYAWNASDTGQGSGPWHTQNLCVDMCMFISVQDSSSSLSECMWGQKTVLAVNPQMLATLFITQGTSLI